MRRHRLVNFLATVTVISIGLVTLVGVMSERGSSTALVGDFLIRLVTVTAAVAVLVGILNLTGVHLGRIRSTEHGWPYSILVLLAAVGVIVLRVLDRAEVWSGHLKGEEIGPRVFESVQVSLESALAALLVFFLVFAAYRLLRRRVTVWNTLFSIAAVIVLVGWIPFENSETLADIRDWVVEVPVSAGARGLLIGVGLGTLVAGVRVLMGQDRSYRN